MPRRYDSERATNRNTSLITQDSCKTPSCGLNGNRHKLKAGISEIEGPLFPQVNKYFKNEFLLFLSWNTTGMHRDYIFILILINLIRLRKLTTSTINGSAWIILL